MNGFGNPIPKPIPKGFRNRERKGNGNENGNVRGKANVSTPVTATEVPNAARAFHVSDEQLAADAENSRKALRIAVEGAEQIDELSLIGYPTSLDPATKEVVETVLFYVARGVLEA